uniref:Putative tick kunitz 1 n=1 Tax=Amblyomma cajennense TaxID=34607 RepID=A0A023FN59_AMBCJ
MAASYQTLGKSVCQQPIERRVTGCQGGYVYRFGFNKTSKKCEDYESLSCLSLQGNEFETREKCLRTCYGKSPCLKNKWDYGGEYRKWYYYNTEEDDCLEIPSSLKRNQLFPKGNLFETQAECIKGCMPTFDHLSPTRQ